MTVFNNKLSSLQLLDIHYLVVILFALPPLPFPPTCLTEVLVYHKEDPG